MFTYCVSGRVQESGCPLTSWSLSQATVVCYSHGPATKVTQLLYRQKSFCMVVSLVTPEQQILSPCVLIKINVFHLESQLLYVPWVDEWALSCLLGWLSCLTSLFSLIFPPGWYRQCLWLKLDAFYPQFCIGHSLFNVMGQETCE